MLLVLCIQSMYVLLCSFQHRSFFLGHQPLAVQARKLLFGVDKLRFMAIALIIYWGYGYLSRLLAVPEVEIYFKNLMTDPCFLDGNFIANRTAIVQNACTNLTNSENAWNVAKVQIDVLMNEVDNFFSGCNCRFPMTSESELHAFRKRSLNLLEGIQELGFTKNWPVEVNYGTYPSTYRGFISEFTSFTPRQYDFFAPSMDFEFLGNTTICTDRDFSRDEILVASDTGLSFWELWLSSGLLAGILVKFAIANFGVALLKVADPFCVCDGKYESPPETAMYQDRSNEEEGGIETSTATIHVSEEVTKAKAAALRAIAFRQCLIWGFITNSSLLSLLTVSSSKLDKFLPMDYAMFTVIMMLCTVGPLCCFSLTKWTGRKVDEHIVVEDNSKTDDNNSAPSVLETVLSPKKKKNEAGVMDFFSSRRK